LNTLAAIELLMIMLAALPVSADSLAASFWPMNSSLPFIAQLFLDHCRAIRGVPQEIQQVEWLVPFRNAITPARWSTPLTPMETLP
jgi:hypothetical protein